MGERKFTHTLAEESVVTPELIDILSGNVEDEDTDTENVDFNNYANKIIENDDDEYMSM